MRHLLHSLALGDDRAARSLDLDLLGLTSLAGGESSRAPYTGIKALMLAVLDNGIESYMSSVPRIRNEAECWVNATAHRSPFCFTVVCETLGLEPDAVRKELQRWRTTNVPPQQALVRRRPNVSRSGRLLAHKAS